MNEGDVNDISVATELVLRCRLRDRWGDRQYVRVGDLCSLRPSMGCLLLVASQEGLLKPDLSVHVPKPNQALTIVLTHPHKTS